MAAHIIDTHGKQYNLLSGLTNKIGSGKKMDVVLTSDEAEALHAGIRQVQENVWVLMNLTLQGTSVRHKGRPVSEHVEIGHGDTVTVCGEKFKFYKH